MPMRRLHRSTVDGSPIGCATMTPPPRFHPAAALAIGLTSALLWLLSFPVLRWLCVTVDALLSRIIP